MDNRGPAGQRSDNRRGQPGGPKSRPTSTRNPLRGLVLAVVILMLFPTTRDVVLTTAGAGVAAVIGVVLMLMIIVKLR